MTTLINPAVPSDATENPLNRPPLGLPTGSVRAVLTLLIVAVVVVETGRGKPLDELWSETLLIALAHYFTSRRFVGMTPALLKRLEDEGQISRESNPLFLPKHSIRAAIVLAFAGLAWYVYEVREVRHFVDVPPVLVTVGSYLLGIFARGLWNWRSRTESRAPSRLWEDLKAAAVLLVMLGTSIPYFLGHGDAVPPQMRSITLAAALFYFGSR